MSMQPNLFCFAPDGDNPHEINLHVSEQDRLAFNALPRGGSGQAVTVTDQITLGLYRVRRAPCGLGCYCAAEATLLEEGGQS